MFETKVFTKEDLTRDLKKCGVSKGQAIIVHSSLKSIGFIVGGAETLIRALIEIVGEEGTLIMPSQTWKNLDPSTGVHWEVSEKYWPIIREYWPAYDKEITPAIGMGVAAEMLRKWPGAERSNHPARSIAALGKYAKYITTEHDLSNINGDNSPLDKLYKLDGFILLIGVGYEKNTSLHLSEARANYPSKKNINESSAVMVNGKREWITYSTLAVDDSDFVKLGAQYDKENNITINKLGNADVRLLKQRPFVDWSVKWMEANRI